MPSSKPLTCVKIGAAKLKAEKAAPMMSVLEARARSSCGRRKTANSAPGAAPAPVPSAPAAAGPRTSAAVSAAAMRVRTAMAQKAACQPRRPPMYVAIGRPRRVPSMSPFITTPTARPRTFSGTSCAHSEIAMPKNACAATPLTTRAATIAAYEAASAASRLPARKIAKTAISAVLGRSRMSASARKGPPTVMATAKTVTR